MKTSQHPCSRSLRSIINSDGRRVITLWRTSGLKGCQSRLMKLHPVGQRKGGSKLSVQFAPEEVSAFKLLIRHRLPARRRVSYQPKLQLLNLV